MTVIDKGALAATAAGVAALVAVALVAACSAGPAADVGTGEAQRLASPAASVAPGGTAVDVPVRPGSLPSAVDALAPTRLSIPDIGVTATVDPVGVNETTGEFDVPPSVDEVGWYRFGPGLEAATGSVVIAGHVDGAGQGPGAFFRLRELGEDDVIEIVAGDVERRFRVVAREEYDKARIPLERYFARDGELRLTLITCGGPFDEAARRYQNNIVVTAVPV